VDPTNPKCERCHADLVTELDKEAHSLSSLPLLLSLTHRFSTLEIDRLIDPVDPTNPKCERCHADLVTELDKEAQEALGGVGGGGWGGLGERAEAPQGAAQGHAGTHGGTPYTTLLISTMIQYY